MLPLFGWQHHELSYLLPLSKWFPTCWNLQRHSLSSKCKAPGSDWQGHRNHGLETQDASTNSSKKARAGGKSFPSVLFSCTGALPTVLSLHLLFEVAWCDLLIGAADIPQCPGKHLVSPQGAAMHDSILLPWFKPQSAQWTSPNCLI